MGDTRVVPKMPESVQVGPHRYSVTDSAKEHARETRDVGESEGISNHRTCKITVNPKQHLTQKQDTLLHEILHSVWRNSDWDTQIPKHDPEEYVIRRMTATLLDVIQRNPTFVAYLQYTGDGESDLPPADPESGDVTK